MLDTIAAAERSIIQSFQVEKGSKDYTHKLGQARELFNEFVGESTVKAVSNYDELIRKYTEKAKFIFDGL